VDVVSRTLVKNVDVEVTIGRLTVASLMIGTSERCGITVFLACICVLVTSMCIISCKREERPPALSAAKWGVARNPERVKRGIHELPLDWVVEKDDGLPLWMPPPGKRSGARYMAKSMIFEGNDFIGENDDYTNGDIYKVVRDPDNPNPEAAFVALRVTYYYDREKLGKDPWEFEYNPPGSIFSEKISREEGNRYLRLWKLPELPAVPVGPAMAP